jgi:glycopeptide antibiotics resistance protein
MRSAEGKVGVQSGQRQPRRPSGWIRVAALLYIAALALVTLLPIAPVRRPSNYQPQLVPFEGILGELTDSPVERLAELFGNVLLFAPLGFLLPLLVPAIRRWWKVLAVGAGVSLLIELYQLAWPGVRKASVNDLLMNALGAVLGFAALRRTGYRRGGSSRRAPGCRQSRPP